MLLLQNDEIEIERLNNRFNSLLENMQKDIDIISKASNISEGIEIYDNSVLSNWGKAFLGRYSTIIFLDDKNNVISRASDQYRFGDKINDSLLQKIENVVSYKGIATIDNKDLLVFSNKIKNASNSVVGTVILGITIDERFLKNIQSLKSIALLYKTSKNRYLSSTKIHKIHKEKIFKTHIDTIDKEERFLLQTSTNEEIQNLKNFKMNIIIFAVIICLIIIFLLYIILTNFLRPYKKIYNLLFDFANNKVDFKYIRHASRRISRETQSKEIFYMAKAINKVSKKTLKNEEALKKISHTDQLTKILNRRRLDEILLREAYEANRYETKLSIIIIDIDHFKNINDTHGHPIGDKILKQFSSTIDQYLRTSDYFGRWGGEEFLVISTNTDLKGATMMAEKLRDIIRRESYALDIKLTASFGVGEIQRNENVHNLISRTDEALYKAKNRGRDRIELAD